MSRFPQRFSRRDWDELREFYEEEPEEIDFPEEPFDFAELPPVYPDPEYDDWLEARYEEMVSGDYLDDEPY